MHLQQIGAAAFRPGGGDLTALGSGCEGEHAVHIGRLPFRDGAFTAVLDILTPASYGEFRRVLRPGGRLIKVYPGSGYLRELRAARNMQPYAEGQVEDYLKEKAQVLSEARVTYTLPVTAALWRDFVWMTPLNQDLSEEEKERLALLPAETVTVDLHVAAVKLNGQD